MKSQTEQLFDVLSSFPEGLTAFEAEALQDGAEKKQKISALLSLFVTEGIAEKRGAKVNPATGQLCTIYAANGVPFAGRTILRRKDERGKHVPRKTADRIAFLNAQVERLEQWKAAAIARYPDLAVDPIVAEARERIAAVFAEEGAAVKAQLVLAGDMDGSDAMRAVVAMMRGAF